MKIRVGFSTTDSWYSRIIRWATNADISHSYIRLYDPFLKTGLILHSDFVGVVIGHAEKFEILNHPIVEYEIDDGRLDEAVRKNLYHLGKGYAYWDLCHWTLVVIFKRWFKRKIKNPVEDPKKLICVDFILYILNGADVTQLPLGIMSPKTFRDWCEEHYSEMGWKRISYAPK